MALTPEQVNYVAHLARLTLTPAEVELFTRQLNDILDYVEKLKPPKEKFVIDKFFLKKSELFPEGPVYENLKEYNLV